MLRVSKQVVLKNATKTLSVDVLQTEVNRVYCSPYSAHT